MQCRSLHRDWSLSLDSWAVLYTKTGSLSGFLTKGSKRASIQGIHKGNIFTFRVLCTEAAVLFWGTKKGTPDLDVGALTRIMFSTVTCHIIFGMASSLYWV